MQSSARRLAQGLNVPNETLRNGDSPASTLAAQIVDNLARAKNHPKHQDQERFRKLLREILDTDEDGDEATRVTETNTSVNCRLIYVVIRAGLEVSFNQDPFVKQDGWIKQALESLSVVGLTLRRCPGVLFSILEGCETDLQFESPLYLWLVPRLFIILVRIENKEVRVGVLQVLRKVLIVEKRDHLNNLKLQSVLKYVQGCVNGQSKTIL